MMVFHSDWVLLLGGRSSCVSFLSAARGARKDRRLDESLIRSAAFHSQVMWHLSLERSKLWSQAMKPMFHSAADKRRFPQTDYFFHSGTGGWRGYSSSFDGEDRSEFRT